MRERCRADSVRNRVTRVSGTTGLPATVLTRRTWLALACFVHAQRTSSHLKPVHVLDGGLRIRRRHLDEAEATWAAGFAIVHQFYRLYRAVFFEQTANVCFGGAERQVANVDRRHRFITLEARQELRTQSRFRMVSKTPD